MVPESVIVEQRQLEQQLKAPIRNYKHEADITLGMADGFKSSKPTSSDVFLPTRIQLLNLPDSTVSGGPGVQMFEMMGNISLRPPPQLS